MHFPQVMQVHTVFAAEHKKGGWRFEAVSVYGSYHESGSCSPGRHIFSPDCSLVASAFRRLRAGLAAMAVVHEQHFYVCFSEAAAFGLNPQGQSE